MNIKKIYLTARSEYSKWICNPRMIIIGVMVMFIISLVIMPLKSNAKEMGAQLNVLEPFIAMSSSYLIIIIIPAVFLTLIADFPRTDGNTLLFLNRSGKINWVLGQVLFIIFAIFTFIAILFITTVLPVLFDGVFKNQWSTVITDYAEHFPEKRNTFAANLITENLYNQVSPVTAAIQSYLLMMLYLMLLAMIMLFFNVLQAKIVGLFSAAAIIAFGGTLCIILTKAMWIFPMAHSIIWLHYTKYFREANVEMYKSFAYFIILIFLLVFISCVAIDVKDFDSVQDID